MTHKTSLHHANGTPVADNLNTRLFCYGDAQRYRLGVNHLHIPVNAPCCPSTSYHRDGAMHSDGNLGAAPTYFPNSRDAWKDRPEFAEPPLPIEGAAGHWDQRIDKDHGEQTGNIFRKMSASERASLFANIARQPVGASRAVQERHVANCSRADPAYAPASLRRSASKRQPIDSIYEGTMQ
ncbi:catalase [Sphingopyxis fribergensis]|uniref:catalase n=1 Tax=Sphingopyxis fribergensis TaxID=1515612 RepID=A0A0A7PEJ6_9SPHN|nr:catalase [Sphingopyxis fribergensis]AJA08531.1 catalase [Sphingopyxis fribergensis]